MNEITIHGNVTADVTLRCNAETGNTAVIFNVAVNSRWYDRRRNQYTDRPAVFHRVVCFGDLAENVAATVTRGMAVTVTGQFADDSYTPQGRDHPVRRIRLEAADVAVSLRRATAAVTRRTRDTEPPPADPTDAAEAGQDNAAAAGPATATTQAGQASAEQPDSTQAERANSTQGGQAGAAKPNASRTRKAAATSAA